MNRRRGVCTESASSQKNGARVLTKNITESVLALAQLDFCERKTSKKSVLAIVLGNTLDLIDAELHSGLLLVVHAGVVHLRAVITERCKEVEGTEGERITQSGQEMEHRTTVQTRNIKHAR